MAYSITNIKSDLSGVLHGTTLNQVQNINGLIYRAARQVLTDIDPQETKRQIPLVNSLYNGVYDYSAPADLKGTKIIDIRPQVNRQKYDNMGQTYSKSFDLGKGFGKGESFTVNFNSMIKTLKIKDTFLPEGVLLNECDSVTGNGTWVASGDASNLSTDNVNYASGSGSLKFDLGAAGSVGVLSNTLPLAIDLTTYKNQSTIFAWVYLPTAADFTSITLRFGSDNANYYEVSTSVTQQGTVFQNGWNLLAFTWLGATVVGSPVVTAIDYMSLRYTYNGNAQTAVRLDNIIVRSGTIFDIVYYSKFLFRDAITGAFQETITDESNLVNLDTETYDILFSQVAYLASQQVQGYNATNFDAPFFLKKYTEQIAHYKMVYKSEYIKPSEKYYKKTTNNFNQWANERFVR